MCSANFGLVNNEKYFYSFDFSDVSVKIRFVAGDIEMY